MRTDDPRLVPRKWRHMVGVEAVERALQRLATLCAPSHVPVIYASYRNALDDRVRGTARRLGFIVVNVDGRARARLAATGRDYSSLRLSASDPHPSPEYHALIADAIYEDAVRPWLLARHREAAEPR